MNSIGHLVRKLFGNKIATKHIFVGSLFGPVIGVSLLLFSMKKIPVGVASTLSQMSPIILVFVAHFLLQEKQGIRTFLGTLVAFAGVTLFFLFP